MCQANSSPEVLKTRKCHHFTLSKSQESFIVVDIQASSSRKGFKAVNLKTCLKHTSINPFFQNTNKHEKRVCSILVVMASIWEKRDPK